MLRHYHKQISLVGGRVSGSDIKEGHKIDSDGQPLTEIVQNANHEGSSNYTSKDVIKKITKIGQEIVVPSQDANDGQEDIDDFSSYIVGILT